MAEGVGFLTISAVGEESVVNTAVNATQRVRNLEFTPDAEYAHLLDESLQGHGGRVTPDLGMVDIRGSWRCYDTYTLQHALLKHFFGTLASGRYTFIDKLTVSLTWAIEKTVSVWELSGVFINQLALNWSPETVDLSGTLIAMGLVYTGSQNTTAELAALIPNVAKRCKIAPDLNIRLGVASAALGSPEEIKAPTGTLTLTRPLAETHYNGTRSILQPSPDNFYEGTLAAELTRYDTNQFQTWKAANTRLSARLFFDEESGSRTQEWLIPNITLATTPNPVSGAGFIPSSFTADLSIGQETYTATTLAAVAATSKITDSANGIPFVYPGAEVFIAGFTGTAANNQKTTVVSRASNGSEIVITGTLVDDAAGESVTLVFRNPFVQVNEA